MRVGYLALALIAGLAGASQAQAQVRPAADIAITSPAASTVAVGTSDLSATVSTVRPSDVTSVEFFVDGVPACAATRAPFSCSHAFGERVTPHLVRALATMADGSYAATSVITAVPFGELTDVSAVLVTAVVTDKKKRFVKGLTKDDFQIVDNGKPQSIMFFESEKVPTDVVLAVDASASMTESQPILKAAVKRFLSQLQSRGHVRATVLGFNQAPFTVTRTDVPLAQQLAAVDGIRPVGRSHVFDAIISGIRAFRPQVSRKAVIVFTDGDDNGSLSSIPAIRRRLGESDATLYVITHGKAGEKESARKAVSELAGLSGGRPIHIDRLDELGVALDNIVDDLSNLYLMGYMPSDPPAMGDFRPYTVTTKSRDQKVRTRDGYRMHRVDE